MNFEIPTLCPICKTEIFTMEKIIDEVPPVVMTIQFNCQTISCFWGNYPDSVSIANQDRRMMIDFLYVDSKLVVYSFDNFHNNQIVPIIDIDFNNASAVQSLVKNIDKLLLL